MARRDRLRDPHYEARLFFQRVVIASVVVVGLTVVLATRLFFLQKLSYSHYQTLSENNRVRLRAVAPTRGLIYDRNGVLLAGNEPSYSLEITPEAVDDMAATLTELQQLVSISEDDVSRFRSALKSKRPFEGIPLLTNLDDEQVARIAANRHRFPGVDIVARLTRHYPQAELFAHTLGYVGRIDERELQQLQDPRNYTATQQYGKQGVERYYEDLLHGRVGFQQVEVNAAGRVLRVLEEQPAEAGETLYLTLDARLQRAAWDALGNFSGALVAMDPNNGDVLAMVSKPAFDPNLFVHGISTKNYKALNADIERPLFNRALSGQYPPGSTVKPFIGLAGLEYRVIGGEQHIFCPGYYMLPNDERKYRDWKKHGHGAVTLADAITQSCDVYFYDLSLKLGIDRMSEYMAQFGFGAATGLDSFGEATGILPSREWKRNARQAGWYPGETLITAIGQGYMTATPLQLASATATLAKRGLRLRPHLLWSIAAPPAADEEPVADLLAQVEMRQPGNWLYVINAMRDVAHSPKGTAYRTHLGSSYKLAGKSGTAQVAGIAQDEKYDEETTAYRLRDHALYIGFAPLQAPKIVVAVIVEHGGSGSSVAAPVVRKVMDLYLNASSSGVAPQSAPVAVPGSAEINE